MIDDPEDEVVAATLASIIKLALRCAFSTGDKVGSFSTEEKQQYDYNMYNMYNIIFFSKCSKTK